MCKVKLFYLLTIVVSLNLISCSQSEFQEMNLLQSPVGEMSELASDSVYVINGYEAWNNLFDVKSEIQDKELETRSSMLLSGAQSKFVRGYTSSTSTKTYRTIFTKEMAKLLSLRENTIYHVYLKIVRKEISIPTGGLVFTKESPSCGFKPVYSDNQSSTDFNGRGYKSITNSGSKAIFETHVFYVKNEEWGSNINRDYPCKLDDLVWDYTLWTN